MPGAQTTHAAMPALAANRPTAQSVQPLLAVLDDETRPAGHCVQTVAPRPAEYVPACARQKRARERHEPRLAKD